MDKLSSELLITLFYVTYLAMFTLSLKVADVKGRFSNRFCLIALVLSPIALFYILVVRARDRNTNQQLNIETLLLVLALITAATTFVKYNPILIFEIFRVERQ